MAQGSLVRPFLCVLYQLYVNDLPLYLTILPYADDGTIHTALGFTFITTRVGVSKSQSETKRSKRLSDSIRESNMLGLLTEELQIRKVQHIL